MVSVMMLLALITWDIPTIAAVAAGVVLVVGSIGGQFVLLIAAYGKIGAIEGHVNSEKTAADGREAALLQQIALKDATIADLRTSAALLAQAAAQRPAGTVAAARPQEHP